MRPFKDCDLLSLHALELFYHHIIKILIPVIIQITGCANQQEDPDPEYLVKVPVAFLNHQNKYLSLSKMDTTFTFKNNFDSTCLFEFVSLNDDMKTLIGVCNNGYLDYDFKKEKIILSDAKDALILNIKDMGGSFLGLNIKNGSYLSIDSVAVCFEPDQSYRNIFYAVYDPVFRHSEYRRCLQIEDFENQLAQDKERRTELQSKAVKRDVSLKDMILLDAIWLYKNKGYFNFRSERVLDHFENIRNSQNYMKMIREKAKKEGVSHIRMVWIDANYLLRKELNINE